VRPAALRALADAAEALARLAREAAGDSDGEPRDDALVPLAEAARLAATSLRVVRDAIRRRELTAFGRTRDRAVRRADLDTWIASREVRPIRGVQDADIERRMARLARTRLASESRRALSAGPGLASTSRLPARRARA
jgi:hypothetical protein